MTLVATQIMRHLFNDENEPFWRSAKPIELGVIVPGPSLAYIVKRFASHAAARSSPTPFDAVLRDRLGGYWMRHHQELCYFLWQLTAEGRGRRPRITSQPRSRGVLRSWNAHFATGLGPRLGAAARAAAGPGRMSRAGRWTTDYRRRHDLPSPSTVQKRVWTALKRQELGAQRRRRRADRRALPLLSGSARAPAPRRPRTQSSSSSSSSPARRITIWSSSIVTSTGRWPAQCSA